MRTDKLDSTKQRDRYIDADSDIECAEAEGPSARQETEEEEQAKLECLRAAAKEAFDSIDRGEGIILNSSEEVEAFLKEIHEEVMAELGSARKRA